MPHHTLLTTRHLSARHPLAGRIGLKKILIIAGVIVAVLIIAAFSLYRIVYNQLPGDPLYGLKTVTERLFGGMQLTSAGRVDHNITLLESRLNELNRYALGIGSSSPEQLTKIAEQSDNHTKDALNLIAADASLDIPARITLLTKIDSVVRAEETLGDSIKDFSPITDTIATNEKRVNDALRTAIGDFVTQSATDTIEQLIAEKITNLGKGIPSIAPGSSAAKTVAKRVTETNDALIDYDYKAAIIAIIRAEQAIAIDGYLWNAERGPVDGVPVDNGPIPEGN